MKSLSLTKPHLIIMVGIPGSGKTFFAEHFSHTFKAPFICSERLRFELFGDPTYCQDEDRTIEKVTNYMLDEVFKTGRTAIYEGPTDLHSERILIARKTRQAGYEPLFVWVQTESATALKRATTQTSEKQALTIEQFERKINKFKAPHQTEKNIVISGKHTYASQLKIVLKRLVEPRQQTPDPKHSIRRNINRNILIR